MNNRNIEKRKTLMKSPNKSLKSVLSVALAATSLLVIPLIATFLTEEVDWNVGDYVFAWILIFMAGVTYKLASERMSDSTYFRVAVGVGVFATLALIWTNLAVGIIGSENNSFNLWYFGIIIVITVSTLIAQFKPKGMALALMVTALTQALITMSAFIIGMHHTTGSSVSEILLINGFFVVLFLISAGLFRQAAYRQNNSELEAIG